MQIWRTAWSARDELHESKASQALVFCFDDTPCFIIDLVCSILLCLPVVVYLNATEGSEIFHCSPLKWKQWIHAVHWDKGKEFTIAEGTKVCSLHFRPEDLRKSFYRQAYVVCGGVPTRFAQSVPSPRKRKAPPERHPLPRKKKLFTSAFTRTESQETNTTVESPSESTSTTRVVETSEIIEPENNDLELNVIGYREKTEEMEQELITPRQENIKLRKKLADAERQQEAIFSRFSLERFTSDAGMNFYTGLWNYAIFMAIFNFLSHFSCGVI